MNDLLVVEELSGRELGLAVAEKRGWTDISGEDYTGYPPSYDTEKYGTAAILIPAYYENIAAAWMLFRDPYLVGQVIYQVLPHSDQNETGMWCCTSHGQPVYGSCAAEAISRAWLKAALARLELHRRVFHQESK